MHPTVYVVDGDPKHRQFVVRLAKSMSASAESFASGLEFMDALDHKPSACLVTDVRIADISGLQLQQRLLDEDSPLPVIFVTAHATTPTVVRALRAGAVDFFEKPVEENLLWDSIQRALHLHEHRLMVRRKRAESETRLKMLSPAEREILQQSMEGKRNREIAVSLGISLRTVEARRCRVMEKLQAASPFDVFRLLQATREAHCAITGRPCDSLNGNGHADAHHLLRRALERSKTTHTAVAIEKIGPQH